MTAVGASTTAVVVGAPTVLVVGAASLGFLAGQPVLRTIHAARRSPDDRDAAVSPKWEWVGIGVFIAVAWLARTLFPWQIYMGEFVSDGVIELPGNVGRTLALAGAAGLVAWVIVLMLPLHRSPALRRFAGGGEGRVAPRELAFGERGDLLLCAVATLSVVAPAPEVTDALTAPISWPIPQVVAACLLLLPLVKRRNPSAALAIYKAAFLAYALLMVRLVITTSPGLDPPRQAVLAVAFVAVLVLSVVAHVRTTYAAHDGRLVLAAGDG